MMEHWNGSAAAAAAATTLLEVDEITPLPDERHTKASLIFLK
jgi:hypothetical protein